MKHLSLLRFPGILCLCLGIAALTLLRADGSVHAAFPTVCAKWQTVASPNGKGSYSTFYGIATLSTSDIWAVGYTTPKNSYTAITLTEHWNGTQWSIVASPNAGTSNNILNAATAVSSNDAWAVGYRAKQTLIEHWNGNKWAIVNSPNPSVSENELDGVSAVSTKNVWAVGQYFDNNTGSEQTLIEHWNGSQWSVISSPNGSSSSNVLDSISVASANDIWAAGEYFTSTATLTLIEHWDGTQWSVVSSPNSTSYNTLRGVVALSATNVWVVGYHGSQTLTERWNGTQWSIVSSPNRQSNENFLYGVSATSANDVWAVGFSFPNSGIDQTLIEQWNGKRWSIVASPNPGPKGNLFRAVASIPGNKQVWAVGIKTNKDLSLNTFTASYC